MEKNEAEKIIAQYLKPVFGFALKRCKNVQDAEDLSQEIAWKAYRALVARNDIADSGKFIWTVAHNALANYYRGKSGAADISFEEAENLPFPLCGEIETEVLEKESAARLRKRLRIFPRCNARSSSLFIMKTKSKAKSRKNFTFRLPL